MMESDRFVALPSITNAQIFELGVVEDAVLGTLAPHARFFHTAERRDLRRDEARVDSHDAVFERLSDTPGAREVARVEVCREAELGVVGHADGFLLGAEAKQ